MKNKLIILPALALLLMSFARPDKEFKVYQFPQNMTPRIDGDFSDWKYNSGFIYNRDK